MADAIEVVLMADTVEVVQGTATVVEAAGATGPQGPAGAAGQGVPVGGSTGQVLRKASSTNYDTEWAAAASGSAPQADDYEVTDPTKGIILKSSNNTRWRLTIDNNGSLLRTALATLILSALMLCGAQAQVRDLVYGTNNVVVGPTNGVALSFTNSVAFSNAITFGTNAGAARTNLGFTAPWLTNTTNAGALNRYLVSAGENGEFVTWANVPNVIAGSYSLKGDEGDPYTMDATNVMAYFRPVNQWRIYDVESFRAALFPSGNLSLINLDPNFGEYNTTVSATTIEARYYQNSDGPNVGRLKIGGVSNAQWELLAGTDGNTSIVRTNYLPSVSGELVTTTLTNVSAPAARTNLGLGSLATNNSVPSGAATTNSLLRADGAGGSAFVATLPSLTIGVGTNTDVTLQRETNNALSQRNGTNPQTLFLFNTYSNSTNYERASLTWALNRFSLIVEAAGTGTARGALIRVGSGQSIILDADTHEFRSAGFTQRLGITSSGVNVFTTLLLFGGTTSSFPAIKRSSTVLQVRLADDTAYTTIDAQHRLQGTAPTNSTNAGTPGDIRYDTNNFLYICVSSNTWRRTSLTNW